MEKQELEKNTIRLNKLCKSLNGYYRSYAQQSLEKDEVISPTGLAILTSIYHNPQNDTISHLAEHIDVSKGLVSREVERLRQDGYILTVCDENDRRMVRLTIKDSAVSIIKRELDRLVSLTEELTKDISGEEFSFFMQICDKIQNNADALSVKDNI